MPRSLTSFTGSILVLIVRHIPRVGNFDMAIILDNGEGLEINLVPKAFLSPGSAGKALGTRLPKNNPPRPPGA